MVGTLCQVTLSATAVVVDKLSYKSFYKFFLNGISPNSQGWMAPVRWGLNLTDLGCWPRSTVTRDRLPLTPRGWNRLGLPHSTRVECTTFPTFYEAIMVKLIPCSRAQVSWPGFEPTLCCGDELLLKYPWMSVFLFYSRGWICMQKVRSGLTDSVKALWIGKQLYILWENISDDFFFFFWIRLNQSKIVIQMKSWIFY